MVGTAGAKGYREYPGLGWTVLVRHNAEDALAPVAALRQSMLWWGLTASFGLGILAFLASMIVARPVRALERTATDLNSENTALATQLLKIAEVAPGVICSFKLSPNGKTSFSYAAANMKEIYGIDPAAVREDAAPILKLVHPGDSDRINDLIAASAQTMSPWHAEFRYRHPNKGEIWIEGHSSPSREADGSIVWHGFIHDVTQRKQSEEALANVRRLDTASQLAAGVAHDFNNLLTVISGNLQLAEDGIEDASARIWVRRAIDAAEAGVSHNRRLLALAGGRELEPADIDVNSRVVETVRLLERTLGQHIRLEAEPGSDIWPTHVDPGEFDSALLNLALNARDAMTSGGRITIDTANVSLDEDAAASLSSDARAGDYVRLRIRDTGTGMSPEVLQRAGEPLFTTKEQGKGTGLGLSSVIAFARQSDGFVTIASKQRLGTTVIVYLPRAVPAPASVYHARFG